MNRENRENHIRRLLVKIMKQNRMINERQRKLVDRYEDVLEKQRKQEFWIKATRYLAFPFIIVRICYFLYNNLF